MSLWIPFHDAADSALTESVSRRLWLWSAGSVIASVLSMFLFYLYGHWHWHEGPWQLTFPGQLGLSWRVAVGASKACSVLLSVISLVITITVFRRKGYRQAFASLPTCFFSLTTVLMVT